MKQISTENIATKCTQNGAIGVECNQVESQASDSDPLQVIQETGTPCSSGESKVAVFRKTQSLKDKPLTFVSRSVARQYVADGSARWTAGGKKLQLLRTPTFDMRGVSASLGFHAMVQVACGSRYHEALALEWTRTSTKGPHQHAKDKESDSTQAVKQLDPAA